jgi:hypothetical protein
MKEAEWLICKDPRRLLAHLRRKAGARKLRLFAVACCRRLEPLLVNEAHRLTLEQAERLADGAAGGTDSPNAYSGAGVLGVDLSVSEPCTWSLHRPMTLEEKNAVIADWHETPSDQWYPLATVSAPTAEDQRLAAHRAAAEGSASAARAAAGSAGKGGNLLKFGRTYGAERRAQAHLLRDIMGNPFHRVTTDQAWLTPSVVSLAQGAYLERAFDRMPILGDALEEAGCVDVAILAHCREPIEHVRGCWVVDVLLGKS